MRYVLFTDVREQYNSNVFAGMEHTGQWDLVTEVEPGFRFYLQQPRSLFWVSYGLLFQLYARTEDPEAERNLLGYSNDLRLEYAYLLSQRTGIRLSNRLIQGSENTSIQGGLTATGAVRSAFYTTGSKYISNGTILELQHLLSERWDIRPRLDFQLFRTFDTPEVPEYLPPANSYALTASNMLGYTLTRNRIWLETDLTYLLEDREIYPTALTTYLFAAAPNWRYELNEFWDATLGAGVNVRAQELFVGAAEGTTYNTTWGPTGRALLRYREAQRYAVTLEYAHGYEVMAEFDTSTVSETDTVALAAFWSTDPWWFEAAGSFRYLRAGSRFADQPEVETGTKLGRFEGSVVYVIVPGISAEAMYAMEIVSDRAPPAAIPDPVTVRPDYTRHLVSLGLSFAWPPPPARDVRLQRRESEYEPLFDAGGGAASEGGGRDDEELLRQRQQQREEQRHGMPGQRARDQDDDRGLPQSPLAR